MNIQQILIITINNKDKYNYMFNPPIFKSILENIAVVFNKINKNIK